MLYRRHRCADKSYVIESNNYINETELRYQTDLCQPTITTDYIVEEVTDKSHTDDRLITSEYEGKL